MVSKERYGIDILMVQEIIGVTNITTVPRCPEHMKGVINLRGKIIPVMDLRLKFGIEPIPYNERTCIIVVHLSMAGQTIPIGVIVDTVLEVIDFAEAEVEPSPNYGQNLRTGFVLGIGKRDSIVNILIDIEQVISQSGSSQHEGGAQSLEELASGTSHP
jgi:purine-binding chemotaxis protein CheW